MFTLAISSLTTSNLPWFVELTFQIPIQYCSLQHWILLSPPDISTTGCWVHFGPGSPVLLPGKYHGQRSLVGCSPWGCKELDTTERPHFHFSLSCIREGNGNPLQCSCLENPRDGGAWWAAVYWVAQSRIRLKRLSSRAAATWKVQP